MNNKKRMMFVLDEDYYFITIKIISILKYMNCIKSKIVDYRKIAYIIAFISDENNLKLLSNSINDFNTLSIIEREKLISIYCKGNIDQPIVKRVLFFLEKRNIVCMNKNNKYGCIDVGLVKNNDLDVLFEDRVFKEDMERIKFFYSKYSRVKSVKYDTFMNKVFGSSEVY